MQGRFKAHITDFTQASQKSGDVFHCVSLSERTIYLLTRIVDYLSWKTRYKKDGAWSTEEMNIIQTWADTAYEELTSDSECKELGVGCSDIPPSANEIIYYPQNPFSQPDFIPDGGYIKPPFKVIEAGDALTQLGIEAGDVVMDILSIPGIAFWAGFDGTVPSIRYEFFGKGELEVHLVDVPQGGFALITLDDDVTQSTLVDLVSFSILELQSYIDLILALLPIIGGAAFFTEHIVEFKFEENKAHSIEIRFIPKLGADVLLGFGGGFRKFTWCSEMAEDCCGEGNFINYNVYYNQQRAEQQYQELLDDGDTAASFGAPPTFQGDESPNRQHALCRTVNNFVMSALRDAAMQRNFAADVIGEIARHLPFTEPITGVVGTAIDYLADGVLRALIDDCEAIRDVACCMTAGLGNLPTTIENVQGALGDCGFPFGSHRAQIAAMVNSVAQDRRNARALIASMRFAYDNADNGTGASEQDCECECPCDSFDIQPVDYLGTGCTYQYMGNCVWGITSSSITGAPNACFRDVQGRCLAWDSEVSALGFPLPGCAHQAKVGCCGGIDLDADCNFSTGVWGGRLLQVSWESSPNVVNYYRIRVVPPDDCEEV